MSKKQVADLEGEGKRLSEDQLRYIHERKTSALLCCAVRLGGMSANCTAGQLKALTDFGYHVGLAFQIVDDLLDFTGDPGLDELRSPAVRWRPALWGPVPRPWASPSRSLTAPPAPFRPSRWRSCASWAPWGRSTSPSSPPP